MFSVEFDGLDKLIRQLGAYTRSVQKAVHAAIYQEGEELMSDSKPLVPVDEGNLRSSGFVTFPQEDVDGDVFVDVGFGGPAGSGNHGGETNLEDVGYAVYVHENLEARHTVGQAKYLEQPLNRRKQGYGARLAKKIRQNL